ncbi:response regulator [Bermanella marisrubri]|uniref:histidine kinase n=1 Tax=Bermanella marisrubri TaxID=207949 RepID=Q1MYT4_9GAMM|nr:HAMP domain-containing sensor histidine kinase [Bermanella marisrubri]EAT11122.1 Signal transduction histidine kinase [Oceanobacter sp. RED65] [Bermanella marisrubri]QIZ83449.1 response regulator [Bermanella marisrubri]
MNQHKPFENDIKQILSLINERGYLFGFPKHIESEYKAYLKKRILQRVPAVGISSIIFLIIFAILDVYLLPRHIEVQTISVRLFLAIPLIVLACLWLYFRPPRFYLWIYSSVFLIVGLSVVWIIWFTHINNSWLPYEGLMIIMTYGFVVMGLPIVLASLLNAIMVLAYAFSEPLMHFSMPVYLNNVTFLVAMYFAGIVSAWILSYAQRGQFLHQYLLTLNEKQAKAEIESRNRYLAAASHDLRQPMQAINMLVESLDHDLEDVRIKKLKTASSNMSNMFTQLLDMSRINLDLMEINRQVVHVKPLIESIVSPLKLKADSLGIAFHCNVADEQVHSDPAALQRIFSNLIQNALNHSNAKNINILSQSWQDSTLIIIADDGKGIPDDAHEHIFDAFSRLEGQQDDGLGLGLAIVKELSHKLGHDVKLVNDDGAKFIITLPKATSTKSKESSAQILIVDDDGGLLSQYQQWFIRWGWDVLTSHSIEEAKAILHTKPNWVLSDMYLEDGTANDLFSYIQDMHDYMPNGILVSGSQSKQVQETADRFDLVRLAKPVSPSRLRSALISKQVDE